MIHVIAVISAKPGMRDSILQAFRANVPAVKAEAGSDLAQNLDLFVIR